jgi:hypothetical protein
MPSIAGVSNSARLSDFIVLVQRACSNAFYTMVKTHLLASAVLAVLNAANAEGFIYGCLIKRLRLRFGFYLEDLSPERAEFLFKTRLAQRVVPISQFQGDIYPVLRPQRVERGRKEDGRF